MANEVEIHRMAHSKDAEERQKSLDELRNFIGFIDKGQAWKDLMLLTKDKDIFVRINAAEALGSAFAHVTDKDQAWKDLLALTKDKDINVQGRALHALGSAFAHVTDKDQAWKDLLALTKDKDISMRIGAAYVLNSVIAHVTNKDQAWKDLLALAKDKDSEARFQDCEGSKWKDLLALIKNKDKQDKREHIRQLLTEMWKDLLALTKNKNSGDVPLIAASALGSAFAHVTDKDQATKDLLVLTKNKSSDVRSGAASALGSAFAHVTDKDQATKDLLALTKDKDIYVRLDAAVALGSAFAHVTNKDEAWKDLMLLTKDKNISVRASANHSLGRVHIFKAAEKNEEKRFRKELEKAIEFFEKSSREESFFKPAKFCLPFYKSFYTITFKKGEAEAEVQEYLNEAKNAVEGSESKEKLLEAVENLSNALKEAQQARNFNEIKHNLNAYRRYCDRACELLDTTEEKVPGASRLIRKGLPIIDERIKEILSEIQGKAKALCEQTQGTPFADLGNEVSKAGQNLLKVGNPIALDKAIGNMQSALSAICARMPEEEKREACELLKKAKDEPYVEDRINLTNMVLSKISSNMDRIIIYAEEVKVIKGDLIMGDVFKNIQNATIINKAIVIDSFNKIKKEHDEDVAKALLQIGEFIEKSGDVSAGILYNKFNEELNKPQPEKSTLKKIWEGIEKTLPTIVTISEVIAKIAPLF